MAATLADNTAKLQLDEETGEMVSKNELKKRTQKRAKKAATAARATALPNINASGDQLNVRSSSTSKLNPTSMFEQGWLADVYRERPVEQTVTRFPPEPNGYLHLGHAKAIAVNFGFARAHNGKTILRFDDTNPAAETEEYFTAIKDIVQWLGFQPAAVTYTSDNFDRLYNLAERLIGLGKAYVCYCDKTELTKQRGGKDGKDGPRYRCAHAEQDVELNLTKFRKMRAGRYKAKEAVLRMKQDITNPNPQMWDIAAYRIPETTHHHRTGDKWKIYPTYDFAHCLCDSFEDITHSLCTTEFVLSRESYEWLNSTLGVYEPMQREYGRLNVDGTVMSKTAIRALIDQNIVTGWDDPRLYTLRGLRRRGVPPGAILSFLEELGVTTANTSIRIARFDQSLRRFLEKTVPRIMLVLDPIPVVIEGFESVVGTEVDVPFSPKDGEMGSHKVLLTKTVFIDRSDFREADDKDFYRLAPGKTVGLLTFPSPILATRFSKNDEGLITKVEAVASPDGPKPRAYIHWVPEGSETVEIRVHSRLFNSDDPLAVEGGLMQDVNRESEIVYKSAMIENGFDEVRRRSPWPKQSAEHDHCCENLESVRFQAMRIGYFAMDSDTTVDRKVFNRIVSLREDAART